ncbi:unnamed protein product [Orchesella dallaii]|uniref:Sepiapterin reductase n=1 Tax=Orchesella dallaii TaxID=48710 RepID=A0ABP1QRV6_9HEXA
MTFWGQKTFCIIAGASRGIGRSISIKFSENVAPGSVFLLLARTKDALETVKQEILQAPSNNCKAVIATALDLSNPNQQAFNEAVSNAFTQSGTTPSDFQHSILVQCAASLGIDKGYKVQNIQDVQYIKNYFDFNVTSFILLNAVFCDLVLDKKDETSTGRQTTIIHISSHGAVEPFKTWGLYCSARAAKNMLLRSISLESPNVQTINYAPGMVDTENYKEAEKHTGDPELVKYFAEQRASGLLLTPDQTVTKLVQILATKKYVKGEHISYDD